MLLTLTRKDALRLDIELEWRSCPALLLMVNVMVAMWMELPCLGAEAAPVADPAFALAVPATLSTVTMGATNTPKFGLTIDEKVRMDVSYDMEMPHRSRV